MNYGKLLIAAAGAVVTGVGAFVTYKVIKKRKANRTIEIDIPSKQTEVEPEKKPEGEVSEKEPIHYDKISYGKNTVVKPDISELMKNVNVDDLDDNEEAEEIVDRLLKEVKGEKGSPADEDFPDDEFDEELFSDIPEEPATGIHEIAKETFLSDDNSNRQVSLDYYRDGYLLSLTGREYDPRKTLGVEISKSLDEGMDEDIYVRDEDKNIDYFVKVHPEDWDADEEDSEY